MSEKKPQLNSTMLVPFAKEGYNVILTGEHGVGKTALIKEVFNEVFGDFNTKWRYFSASTLDPWVDFIGIPKNYTNADGEEVFKIIPPETFTGNEEIEALFFDEINRADPKTLNALMELIQFKSINGRKFPNLKCIWAAENPFDSVDNHYSVEPLDPAQRDRFNIQLNIPYEINKEYFISKYGEELTTVAAKWWETGNNNKTVSPRKLDDMLGGFKKGFKVSLFSNTCKTTDELQENLESIDAVNNLWSISQSNDSTKIKKAFSLDRLRNYEKNIRTFSNRTTMLKSAIPHLDEELAEYIREIYNIKADDMSGNSSSIISGLCVVADNHYRPEAKMFSFDIEERLRELLKYFEEVNIELVTNENLNHSNLFAEELDIIFPWAIDNFSVRDIDKIKTLLSSEKLLLIRWIQNMLKLIRFIDGDVKSSKIYKVIEKILNNSAARGELHAENRLWILIKNKIRKNRQHEINIQEINSLFVADL